MADRDNGVADVAASFVLGALVGAGVALLLAPQSGEKTRKELGKKSRKLKKEAGKQLREAGEEWAEDAGEQVQEWTQQIADAVSSGVETIRETIHDELKGVEKKLGKKGLFG